jgi:hypothetical protein
MGLSADRGNKSGAQIGARTATVVLPAGAIGCGAPTGPSVSNSAAKALLPAANTVIGTTSQPLTLTAQNAITSQPGVRVNDTFEVASDPAFGHVGVTKILLQSTGEQTSVILDSLPSSTYYWHVRASAGGAVVTSAAATFLIAPVLQAPVLALPANGGIDYQDQPVALAAQNPAMPPNSAILASSRCFVAWFLSAHTHRLNERYKSAVTQSTPGGLMPMFRRTFVVLLLISASACSNPTIAVTGTVPSIGQTSQLDAKATLSNGTSQDVTATATWASSNTAIATVTTGGLLKVLALGTAQVTATYQGASGQFPVSLSVASVTVTGTTSLTIGQTSQFTATAHFSNGTSQDQTLVSQWSSSNASVASVSGSGVVTAVSNGSVTITATFQGLQGAGAVAVGLPATFTLTGTLTDGTSHGPCPNFTIQLLSGTTVITSTLTDSNGNYAISGLSAGTYTLSVTFAFFLTTTQQVTVPPSRQVDLVLQRATLTVVTVSCSTYTLNAQADTAQCAATAHYSDGSSERINGALWQALTTVCSGGCAGSNGVASVDSTGLVTDNAFSGTRATVIITATFQGVSGTATFSIVGSCLIC